jgi:hypothetical protein
MNYTIILLSVAVVVLIYILTKVFKKSSKISDKVSLKNGEMIPVANIDKPTSYRYAYGIWIYVNSWSSNVALKNTYPENNNIFNRGDQIQLYLDQTRPTLKFYVKTNATNSIIPITVTENFPIQKWVYFLANVDGQYIDLYLNGKLIKSVKSEGITIQPSASEGIKIGGALDGFAAKFKHWSNPLTPKDVWSNYMNGNGGNSMSKAVSSYGVDVALVKDNIEQKSIRLF